MQLNVKWVIHTVDPFLFNDIHVIFIVYMLHGYHGYVGIFHVYMTCHMLMFTVLASYRFHS